MAIERRDFLIAGAAAAAVSRAHAAPGDASPNEVRANGGAQVGGKPYKHIACEEAYLPAECSAAVRAYIATNPKEEANYIRHFNSFWNVHVPELDLIPARLKDLGAGRIAEMDAGGIDMQMLHIGSCLQMFFDRSQAMELSRLANERLAEAVRNYPGRFFGLVAAPPQFPEQAAQELEYGVHKLGLNGMIIHSHTRGEYLDQPKYRPLLEALNALRVPVYIHPREPSPALFEAYEPYNLEGSIWGYAAEVSVHSLKLIMSGLFDDLPNLQLVIGHGGEGIPFFLSRLDNRFRREGVNQTLSRKLTRLPSEYFKDHFVITTSGMNYHAPLKLCHEVLGADRILFAADYPYESNAESVALIDSAPLPLEDLRKICQLNAERVFKIKAPAPPI